VSGFVLRISILAWFIFALSGCGGGTSGNPGTQTGQDSAIDNTDSADNETEPDTGADGGLSSEPEPDSEGDVRQQPDSGNEHQAADERPNILLIITDDQGKDASAQYQLSNDVPDTPALNRLASEGLVYDNFWATPSCTTTRAAVISGKHGVNNGVPSTPGNLDPVHDTIQEFLAADISTADYRSAVFGKWHIAGREADLNHPASVGVPHYAGNFQGNLTSFYSWDLTTNGSTETVDGYHTTVITDLALDWIGEQTTPWFAWLAYSAPHSPFHLPPRDLHGRELSGTEEDIDANTRDYFLASIEAFDAELGRLLDSLPQDVVDNTLIMVMGDNGSPRTVIDRSAYVAASHGKGSLYDGGINVPFVVSGAGVTRSNERETALVSLTDIFATIAESAGSTATQIYDSISFRGTFTTPADTAREFLYTEYIDDAIAGWAVRNDRYKLIQTEQHGSELYDLLTDPDEAIELLAMDPGNSEHQAIATNLNRIAMTVRNETDEQSPAENPQLANEPPIDITDAILISRSASCADYVNQYSASASDIGRGAQLQASLQISVDNGECVFNGNAIPNHDFNDGAQSFPHEVTSQSQIYRIDATPKVAVAPTALSLTYDNALFLNGVKLDLLAAACFGVGNERTGCNNENQPWRFDPMHPDNEFRIDSHNAHSQSNGAYHYHGNPMALFLQDSAVESPLIGFAADGFPIYGSWINDNGTIRKVQSSYRLMSGQRPIESGSPGGSYDGRFRDDYEFAENHGDLDRCNGMWLDGEYGYYVTDSFPHVMACFSGTPHESFRK